jgi:hypothetical protein
LVEIRQEREMDIIVETTSTRKMSLLKIPAWYASTWFRV